MDRIIYFDNAATTFPKPQSVTDTVTECLCDYCGNAGRGSHPIAMRTAESVYDAREALASFFSCQPERVVFTLNTTYALNMAIKGIMSRGGHLLISNMEHNSTLRPVAELARQRRATYSIFPTYRNHSPLSAPEILDGIISLLRSDTRAIICNHASNICSHVAPIAEIGKLCRRYGLIFIVDAAQSAGRIDIDMERDCIDILCLPAHKGLYGAQGVGMMLVREGICPETLIEGGNGVNSLDKSMGLELPERYEGGTLCAPAIAGIKAAIEFIRGIGMSRIAAHEEKLCRRASEGIEAIGNIEIYSPEIIGGILLFNVMGRDPEDVGKALSDKGFCLRTGYHCAPMAHSALGTPQGGAIRASFGIFNTESEVDALLDALNNIVNKN